MIQYGVIEIDSNNLTESLCDGLTKRIFSDLESYTTHFMQTMGAFYTFNTIGDLLNAEIPLIHSNQYGDFNLSKREALARLVGLFTQATYVDINAFNLYPLPKKIEKYPRVLPGLTVQNGRLQIKVLILDAKKPTRSEVVTNAIFYSKHAISRLIYRFKPMFLSLDIMNLGDCINILLNNACEPAQAEYWVPITNVGSFLLRRDEVQLEIIHVVTFVDENKLTQQQRNDGLRLLAKLQETNPKEKVNFDFGVSQMLQFRAKTTMNLPKTLFNK